MDSLGRLEPRSRVSVLSVSAFAAILFLFVLFESPGAHAASPTITVSPAVAVVGSTITVTGAGFPPNTNLALGWTSQNASWKVQAIPTPQVTGIATTPLVYHLGATQSNATGGFSVQITVPQDYGGSHTIQAYASNGTAISPVAAFTLAPSFRISPSSGPAGTPIDVVAMGLGTGIYSTSYQLYWDNSYVGYLTAVSTGGTANFTIYASGTPGPHYVSIYEGGNGPGYMNPQQAPKSASYYFPPYVPFHGNFTVTPEDVVLQSGSSTTGAAYTTRGAEFGAFALISALVGGAFFVARKDPEERRAVSRAVVAVVIVVLLAVGGIGLYLTTGQGATSSSTNTQTASGPQIAFVPVATVYRPQVTFPVNTATTGPRISVTPDIASVGGNITVNGLGFAPNAQLPLTWTTRQGSNLLGYKLVNKPLRNVTADAQGSFSFSMKVPADLGGVHYVAAGNLTEKSNGTLFIQRTARLSTTQGPQGTQIQIIMTGVGWTFNTNIAAFDYDNSFIGYGCGFNSGGNVTFTIPATGAPGIHNIDIFPSVWWGPVNFVDQQPVVYRLALLTPQDHPELMPSFHFTFLVTSG
jgi:hypothetical protein